MKRRIFLRYSMIAAATGTAFFQCSDASVGKTQSLPATLARIYDHKALTEIGIAYGKAHPDEYNTQALQSLLQKNADGKTVPASSSEADATLDSQVRTDFLNGDTVIIEGYILSISEARQCALYALSSKNDPLNAH